MPFAKKHYQLSPTFQIKILIPRNISDVNAKITKYKTENESIQTTGDRPIAFQYKNEQNKYWMKD